MIPGRAGMPDLDTLGRMDALYEKRDLQRIGASLVQLDAWCRQHGLDDLAVPIGNAIDWVDARLTDG